jgi:3-methyladenine DNA glycosylase AlkD
VAAARPTCWSEPFDLVEFQVGVLFGRHDDEEVRLELIVVPRDPVADLKRRLARAGNDRARAFWTRYVRGVARFRGVPMSKVRTCVHRWWDDHGFDGHPATVGKRIALALIEEPMTEDKLAGILVLQELLGEQLRAADLPAFARLFANGHLGDWNIVDWFCMKVLATLLAREPGRAEVVRTLAQWRTADTIWQRRASCISFAKLAARGDAEVPGLTSTILTVCATVVWSHERFDQTAVGWVLRELSRAEPVRVETFFLRHARLMSNECARYVTARFPPEQRAEMLAHHKRATTWRR